MEQYAISQKEARLFTSRNQSGVMMFRGEPAATDFCTRELASALAVGTLFLFALKHYFSSVLQEPILLLWFDS